MKHNGLTFTEQEKDFLSHYALSEDSESQIAAALLVGGASDRVATFTEVLRQQFQQESPTLLLRAYGHRSVDGDYPEDFCAQYLCWIAKTYQNIADSFLSDLADSHSDTLHAREAAEKFARDCKTGVAKFENGFSLFDPDEEEVFATYQLQDAAYGQIGSSIQAFEDVLKEIVLESRRDGNAEVLDIFTGSIRNGLERAVGGVGFVSISGSFDGLKIQDRELQR